MTNKTSVITRFAPSPTGFLHIGGLRTALFNYLWARQNQGRFILRIEDTDQARLVAGAEEGLVKILQQFGLDFDERLRQSDRLESYQKSARQLVASGFAYKCFCSPERLEQLRGEQKQAKQPPRYDGRCRNLSAEEEATRQGQSHTVRFKVGGSGRLSFEDILRGQLSVAYEELDDFIILKSGGWP